MVYIFTVYSFRNKVELFSILSNFFFIKKFYSPLFVFKDIANHQLGQLKEKKSKSQSVFCRRRVGSLLSDVIKNFEFIICIAETIFPKVFPDASAGFSFTKPRRCDVTGSQHILRKSPRLRLLTDTPTSLRAPSSVHNPLHIITPAKTTPPLPLSYSISLSLSRHQFSFSKSRLGVRTQTVKLVGWLKTFAV